jgi:hypothetical protein
VETEAKVSRVAGSRDEASVLASALPSVLPQLSHLDAAARARAPHFGQTVALAGVTNLDGAGIPSISDLPTSADFARFVLLRMNRTRFYAVTAKESRRNQCATING